MTAATPTSPIANSSNNDKSQKAHRRVSFSAATPISQQQDGSLSAATAASPETTIRPTEETTTTPHHSNTTSAAQAAASSLSSCTVMVEDGESSSLSLSATPHLAMSQSFPQPTTPSRNHKGSGGVTTPQRLHHPHHQHLWLHKQPQQQQASPLQFQHAYPYSTSACPSRRSSLDSCSSYNSSGGFSSSTTTAVDSLASALSIKGEAFHRAKLLDCLEWLSRHVSRQVLQQLIHQIVAEQQLDKEEEEDSPIQHSSARRRSSLPSSSSGPARRRASASGVPRRQSLPRVDRRRCSLSSRRNSINNSIRLQQKQQQRRHSMDGCQPQKLQQSQPHQQLVDSQAPSDCNPTRDDHRNDHNNAQCFSDRQSPKPVQLRRASFVHCDTASSSNDDENDNNIEYHERRKLRQLKTQESVERLSSFGSPTSSFHDSNHLNSHNNSTEEEWNITMEQLGYESTTNSISSWGEDEEGFDRSRNYDRNNNSGNNVMTPTTASNSIDGYWQVSSLPQPQQLKGALLMVDISGFTQLSTTLPLQALSQTINSYFQLILSQVKKWGGDVIKFAGDAIMVFWPCNDHNDGDDNTDVKKHQGTTHHMAIELATACACQVIELCSDYHVYKHQSNQRNDIIVVDSGANAKRDDEKQDVLATLNVHCGLGFGHVLGIHTGDDTRREFFLLGDPIPQVARAIAAGRSGEVLASPEFCAELTKQHAMNEDINKEMLAKDSPKVIFSSRADRFETTPENLLDPAKLLSEPPNYLDNHSNTTAWQEPLQDWDVQLLMRLQHRLSLYVHPAVKEGELFSTIYHNRSSAPSSAEDYQQLLSHDQKILQSEAEIRKVFTLFLQPLIDAELKGDPSVDALVVSTLNHIMVTANRELSRFTGHLRQFMVDDKGIVLIANFGLRGSVFTEMIEEHAMPFAASIQSALRSELGIDCKMGATYGNAYCGVVGGFHRHEYSVLGPAVNLAARLMGNPENRGFLVAERVHRHALGWKFHALEPIQAKGYTKPVPIFEPILHKRNPWTHPSDGFVGRENELEQVVGFLEDTLDHTFASGKMALITAADGFGKSSFLSEVASQIQKKCAINKRSQLILGQVCCEDDLFRPMSVLGPIFLDVLASEPRKATLTDAPEATETTHPHICTASSDDETAVMVNMFYNACNDAQIPSDYVETIHSLVFHHEWPACDQSKLLEDGIVKSIVAILLKSTVHFDMILLGIDDAVFMDELSWRVTQLWFQHACNLAVIGTSSPVTRKDVNMDPKFWDYLFNEAMALQQFLHIQLSPMTESDIRRLVSHWMICSEEKQENSASSDTEFAHEVYLQSGGNPRLVAAMVEQFGSFTDVSEESSEEPKVPVKQSLKRGVSVDNGVEQYVLHRMDSVPAVVRTHLNVAAMLGVTFHADDIIHVMERYRGVPEDEKDEHAEIVHDSLNEAVWHGILAVDENLASRDDSSFEGKKTRREEVTRYRFAHSLWRDKILQLTLDSWQQEMRKLIEEAVKEVPKDNRIAPSVLSFS